jgi:hypothetical protein
MKAVKGRERGVPEIRAKGERDREAQTETTEINDGGGRSTTTTMGIGSEDGGEAEVSLRDVGYSGPRHLDAIPLHQDHL